MLYNPNFFRKRAIHVQVGLQYNGSDITCVQFYFDSLCRIISKKLAKYTKLMLWFILKSIKYIQINENVNRRQDPVANSNKRLCLSTPPPPVLPPPLSLRHNRIFFLTLCHLKVFQGKNRFQGSMHMKSTKLNPILASLNPLKIFNVLT